MTVDKRVEKAVAQAAKKYGLKPKVQQAILKELRRDLILPDMRQNSKIEFEGSIDLQIGPRDWSFDLDTGECTGAGTDVTRL